MRFTKVSIAGLGYELAPNVITSDDLEKRLAPVYNTLHIQPGQLEALTGISERRFWDADVRLSEKAAQAGKKALKAAGIDPSEIGVLIYGGVCRENLEPATACAVAHELGHRPDCPDLSISPTPAWGCSTAWCTSPAPSSWGRSAPAWWSRANRRGRSWSMTSPASPGHPQHGDL